MSHFLNIAEIDNVTFRSRRALDRHAEILLQSLDAVSEPAMQSGGAPATARTPRRNASTAKAKKSTGGDDDGDGPARRFTVSASPTDGIIVGTAAFCTAFMLMAQYGGKAIVPIENVCSDYFHPLTLPNLRRKIAVGDIPLPLVRMEADSKKAAQGVHLQDLADYIDKRRAAAVKERNQLCS